jgi:hypothetical protein
MERRKVTFRLYPTAAALRRVLGDRAKKRSRNVCMSVRIAATQHHETKMQRRSS